jgi:hypothetical protein
MLVDHFFAGHFKACQYNDNYGVEESNLHIGKVHIPYVSPNTRHAQLSPTAEFLLLGGTDLPADAKIIIKLLGNDPEFFLVVKVPYALNKKLSIDFGDGTAKIIPKDTLVVRVKSLFLTTEPNRYAVTLGQGQGKIVPFSAFADIPDVILNDPNKTRLNYMDINAQRMNFLGDSRLLYTFNPDILYD